MSRHEADREDLLREATALVNRMELQFDDAAEPWVVGFRRSGAASLFLGADPVYQFNTSNELRRAFTEGRLVKAESKALYWLDRQRSENETLLIRTPLSTAEAGELLTQARAAATRLETNLNSRSFTCVGAAPDQATVEATIHKWLTGLPATVQAASSPRAV